MGSWCRHGQKTWKATSLAALSRDVRGPARSENRGMYGIFMRENREVPCLARPADHRAGRSGNAEAVRLRCTSMRSLTAP
jgi:hypothetical protein